MRNNKLNKIYCRVTLFLIGCLTSFSLFANDPVSELMSQGQNAIDSKNYKEAIRLYSEVYNLPVATDGQKRLADSKLAYCRTQMRNADLKNKVQKAENLFSAHKYNDCISYCTDMLAIYRSNSWFRNLISRCNDSIVAENNRQTAIAANNRRIQRLSRFLTDLDKSHRFYSTLQYNNAKNIYDSIKNEYPEFKDSIPNWTLRCDSIVKALGKHEAVDWNLIWALNGIREKGSIKYIGNLSEGYFVVSLNNGSLCLLTPDGKWSYLPDTGIANEDWLRFDSGLLGPLYFKDENGYIGMGGGYYSSNRGFINSSGNRVLCDIVNKNDDKNIYNGPYTNGYAVSWHYKGTNKKYGVINTIGETVIPFKYDEIYCLSGGFVCDKGGKVELIDRSYKLVDKFKGHTVSSHYVDCVVVYHDTKRCQLLVNPDLSITDNVIQDYKGDICLKAIFSYPYSNNYALITDDSKWFDNRYKTFGSVWYFVDRNYIQLRNSSNYNKNSRFQNGLAPILREDGWGIIDQFGNTTFIEDYKKQ